MATETTLLNLTAFATSYPLPTAVTPLTFASAYPVEESVGQPHVLAGLLYRDGEGVWVVENNGQPRLLLGVEQLGLAGSVLVSADQSQLAYSEQGEIWLYDVQNQQKVNVTQSADSRACCLFAWLDGGLLFGQQSPQEEKGDGGRLVFYQFATQTQFLLYDAVIRRPTISADVIFFATDTLYRYPLATGSAEPLLPIPFEVAGQAIAQYGGVAESADHRYIAALVQLSEQRQFALLLFSPTSARETAQLINPYWPLTTAWSPRPPVWRADSQAILYETVHADPQERGIWLYDLQYRESRRLGSGQNPLWRADGQGFVFMGEDGRIIFGRSDWSLQTTSLLGEPLGWH